MAPARAGPPVHKPLAAGALLPWKRAPAGEIGSDELGAFPLGSTSPSGAEAFAEIVQVGLVFLS
jgi:hypothetical protein